MWQETLLLNQITECYRSISRNVSNKHVNCMKMLKNWPMIKYWEFYDFLSRDQDRSQDFDFCVRCASRPDEDFVLGNNITGHSLSLLCRLHRGFIKTFDFYCGTITQSSVSRYSTFLAASNAWDADYCYRWSRCLSVSLSVTRLNSA